VNLLVAVATATATTISIMMVYNNTEVSTRHKLSSREIIIIITTNFLHRKIKLKKF